MSDSCDNLGSSRRDKEYTRRDSISGCWISHVMIRIGSGFQLSHNVGESGEALQDDSYAPAAASSMSEWFAFVSAYRISRCLRSPVVDIDSRESLISNSWSACPLVGSDSLTMRNDFTSPCLATPNRYHGSAIYKNSRSPTVHFSKASKSSQSKSPHREDLVYGPSMICRWRSQVTGSG